MSEFDEDSFSDLSFISSRQSYLIVEDHIQNLKSIAQSYSQQILQIITTNYQQFLQNQPELSPQMSSLLLSFVSALKNIFQIFIQILQNEPYIGLLTQLSLRNTCSNLMSKIQTHWGQFTRSLLKFHQHPLQYDTLLNNRSRSQHFRKNQKISLKANSVLLKWLLQNFDHPYPCRQVKGRLAKKAQLNVGQVNNWFTNARERGLKRIRKGKEEKEESQEEG